MDESLSLLRLMWLWVSLAEVALLPLESHFLGKKRLLFSLNPERPQLCLPCGGLVSGNWGYR